jgi:hypothetical protein
MGGKMNLMSKFNQILYIVVGFNKYDYSWLFRRSIVVDGNFSAEHMKMLKAEKDVRLVNGEGYMVEEDRYQRHLKNSSDQKEVSFI